MAPAEPSTPKAGNGGPPRLPGWARFGCGLVFCLLVALAASPSRFPLPGWWDRLMLAGNTDESYTYQFNPYSFQGRCQTQKGWKTSYDPPREDLNETQLAVLTTRMPGFLRAPETAWVSLGGSSRSGMCWDGHRDITDILALPRALASATDDPGRQRYEEALRAWYRLLDEKSPLSAEDVAPRVRQLLASYPELKP